MEEIKVYLEDYDVFVKKYLSYAEIQNIVDQVKKMDSWAERQTAIDMMMMYYVTDKGQEWLEEEGHEKMLRSGFIGAVKAKVENLEDIIKALNYTESTQRALTQILKELPAMVDPLKKTMEKYEPRSTKK